MNERLRILIWRGDNTAVSHYRLYQPHDVLIGQGVDYNVIPYIPKDNNPGTELANLYGLILGHDLVVAQRIPKYEVVHLLRMACDLAGVPLIFETDDDYLHLEPHNPFVQNQTDYPQIKANYGKLLALADGVTTTNKELAQVIYPFNKNVCVLPNNIQFIPCGEWGIPRRDLTYKISEIAGTVSIPAYKVEKRNGVEFTERVVRIGYTGTLHHRKDFETIRRSLLKVLDRHKNVKCIIFGDEEMFNSLGKRPDTYHLPFTYNQRQYMEHLRNFDIGLAPLEPTLFNMTKSPLKAVEYASWGVPALLPNLVTYAREFTHNRNCLMYDNNKEFEDNLDLLITDHQKREDLGQAARDHVRDHRKEVNNSHKRLEFYRSLLKPRLQLHKPNKEIKC